MNKKKNCSSPDPSISPNLDEVKPFNLNVIGKQVNNLIRESDNYQKHQEDFPDPSLLELLFIQRHLSNGWIDISRSIDKDKTSPKPEFNLNDYSLNLNWGDLQGLVNDFLSELLNERDFDFNCLEYIGEKIVTIPDDPSKSSKANERDKMAISFLSEFFSRSKQYWFNKIKPLRIERFILESMNMVLHQNPSITEVMQAFLDEFRKLDESRKLDEIHKNTMPKDQYPKIKAERPEDVTLILDYSYDSGKWIGEKFTIMNASGNKLRGIKSLKRGLLEFLIEYVINPLTYKQNKVIIPGETTIIDTVVWNKMGRKRSDKIDRINSELRKYIDYPEGKKFQFFKQNGQTIQIRCKIIVEDSTKERFKPKRPF